MHLESSYTCSDGSVVNYKYKKILSLKEKISFVSDVTSLSILEDMGYIPLLQSHIFNGVLLSYFTDITAHLNEEQTIDLDLLEILELTSDLLPTLKENIDPSTLTEIQDSVTQNIRFKTGSMENAVTDHIITLLTKGIDFIESLNSQMAHTNMEQLSSLFSLYQNQTDTK